MEIKHYLEKIESSINEMDKGDYKLALKSFNEIIKSNHFNKLNTKEKLFLKKRMSWLQISMGYYKEGWQNYTYHWLKYSYKFDNIKKINHSIKYLLDLNQIGKNEKLLIWNDGGYGDLVFQLRLLKYIKEHVQYNIYSSKIDHLIRDKKSITNNVSGYEWHLPMLEIPRVITYDPKKHNDYKFNYLVEPSKRYSEYKNHIALTYKTDTDLVGRSIPLKFFEKLFNEKKNINFLILQKSLNEVETNFFLNFPNITFINNLDNSMIFNDTFNIINSVKSIISIDTAVAHLAGYLNKRCYLLLKNPSHFYWRYNKSKSLDYQNHIIIRKKQLSNWDFVIDKLIDLLE